MFSDPLCRNIALSGPYGAGKSSVMRKARKRYEKKAEKWIFVSLATFGSKQAVGGGSASAHTDGDSRVSGENSISSTHEESAYAEDAAPAALPATHPEGTAMKRALLESMSIKELVDVAPDADALFEFGADNLLCKEDFEECGMEELRRSSTFPLIRFLVSGGWIDESYRRYMSNSYAETLSPSDDDFRLPHLQPRGLRALPPRQHAPGEGLDLEARLYASVRRRGRAEDKPEPEDQVRLTRAAARSGPAAAGNRVAAPPENRA